MKKKMIALLAGALMMISASSALAAFTGTDELYMAAYNTTSNTEVVIDLGSLVKDAVTGSYSLTSSGVNSFNLAANLGSASAATTQIAFFGQDLVGSNLFASASSTTAPTSAAAMYSTFNGRISFIQTQYGGGTALGSGAASATNSYNSTMNPTFAGQFGGLNGNTFVTPEMSLASLAAGGDLGVYSFGPLTSKSTGAKTGVLQFDYTLVADANGNYTVTTANTAATPIPAAFYLLGSGLMGLVGMRRKIQA